MGYRVACHTFGECGTQPCNIDTCAACFAAIAVCFLQLQVSEYLHSTRLAFPGTGCLLCAKLSLFLFSWCRKTAAFAVTQGWHASLFKLILDFALLERHCLMTSAQAALTWGGKGCILPCMMLRSVAGTFPGQLRSCMLSNARRQT